MRWRVMAGGAGVAFVVACTDFDFAVPSGPAAAPAPASRAPDGTAVFNHPDSIIVPLPSVSLPGPGSPGAVVGPSEPVDPGRDDGGASSSSPHGPPSSNMTAPDAGDDPDGPDEPDAPPSETEPPDAGAGLDAPTIVWLAQVCTNPQTVVLASSGCETLDGDVCFEGETYETATAAFATGDIRSCDGVTQVRAYAYPALSQRAVSRGADGFHARVDVYDAEGQALGSVFDGTADRIHSAWTAFPGATHIVVSAYIFGYESGPRP